MTNNWATKPLGDVCDILDRLRKPITKRDRISGPYPYFGATGVLDHVADYIFDEPLVLIGEDGAKWEPGENSAFTIDGKTWVNNHAHVIRPHRRELLDDWLIYFLNASDLMPFVSGMTVPKLNQGRLREIPIPLPPLEEQRRIVAVLDEAFEGLDRARAHADANLKNSHEFLALQMEHELANLNGDCKHTTIAEVCSRFEYGTSSKSRPIGRMPVLRMGNLQGGEIDWSDLVYSDSMDEILKYELRPLDVLFNRTNSLEHVGKAAIYRGEKSAIFAGYLIRLHYKPDLIQSEFLNLYLNSKRARDYGRAISGKSVNQANISASKLKTYPITLPSLSKQTEIIERVGNMRAPICDLETTYCKKVGDLNNLRQSLLQRAFAGELT